MRTARYWDPDVDDAFRHRERVKAELFKKLEPGIRRKLKRELWGKDDAQQQRAVRDATNKAVEKTREYQAAEKQWLTLGSHWECHYHGSGKIYCLIGRGLADGMKELLTR